MRAIVESLPFRGWAPGPARGMHSTIRFDTWPSKRAELCEPLRDAHTIVAYC